MEGLGWLLLLVCKRKLHGRGKLRLSISILAALGFSDRGPISFWLKVIIKHHLCPKPLLISRTLNTVLVYAHGGGPISMDWKRFDQITSVATVCQLRQGSGSKYEIWTSFPAAVIGGCILSDSGHSKGLRFRWRTSRTECSEAWRDIRFDRGDLSEPNDLEARIE